ncbi:MAG: peptidoglycan editing factor PgeF [Desulfobacterales bacterium]|nr:peptidoglycan editing factor PgeF [Desulfobacterales bacterium]
MFLKRKNNLVYAAFSNLSGFPGLFHGVFTRQGQAGRQEIADCTGVSDLVFLNQVHGKEVVVLKAREELKSAAQNPVTGDALISRVPGAGLVVQAADCQPVMLYDPVTHAAANIHSGWRGSVAGIIGKCIITMKKKFGTDPSDLEAGIGPSLGPCCAEFVNYRKEIPEEFWQYRDQRDRFNFWQISIDQLKAAGVGEKNIELANICTRCNPHLFFSYRKEGETGRFATVIGLAGKRQ